MKDRTSCILDDQDRTSCIIDNCSSEYEDDLMECGDFLDLMGLTKELDGGDVDIYMMAERIATMLGRDAEDSDADSESDSEQCDVTSPENARVEWSPHLEHSLLLAGYTNCMDEAIRFLVEEEQYSVEHPIVQGLKQHLVLQQERVLQEAARDNQTEPLLHRTASCAIRPPSI